MSESNLQFGKYVKQRRESLGKTMRSFAEEVGISPAYLSDIRIAQKPPLTYLFFTFKHLQ